MITIRSFVEKRVEEVENVAVISVVFLFVGFVILERFNPLGMIRITGNFLQDLNLSWLETSLLHRRRLRGNAVSSSLSLRQHSCCI